MNRNWEIVYADIESCCIEHGVNGYLPHEDIEKKIREYDEEEKEARISGKPIHLSGLVFKTFNRQTHVVDPFDIPDDWTRYCIIDPHDRKPFMCTWGCVSPTGKLFIYDEWPSEAFHKIKSSSLVVGDYVTLIREKERGQRIHDRIIDARFGKKVSSQTGRSIRDMFDDAGMYFHDSYLDNGGSVDQGHQAVREVLKIGSDGTPTLRVFSSCQNVVHAFLHYCWDDFKGNEKAPKEKPKDVNKDPIDCVRYFVMEQPRWVDPALSSVKPGRSFDNALGGFYGASE